MNSNRRKITVNLILLLSGITLFSIAYYHSTYPIELEYHGMIFYHDGWAGHLFKIISHDDLNCTMTIDGKIALCTNEMKNVSLSKGSSKLLQMDDLPLREPDGTEHTIQVISYLSEKVIIQTWIIRFRMAINQHGWGDYSVTPILFDLSMKVLILQFYLSIIALLVIGYKDRKKNKNNEAQQNEQQENTRSSLHNRK